MNSFEKAAAVGVIGFSGLAGCTAEENVDVGSYYTVTQAALSWYENGYTRARNSREGVEVCIEDDVFQTAVSVGDKVRLVTDQVDQCLPVSSVKDIRRESEDVAAVICEVEGSVHQLEYLDLAYEIKFEDLIGFSLTGETDNGGGDFDVWWEMEGDLEGMVNPPVIATRETPENGTINTYQYRFDVSNNLVSFVFEDRAQMFSETFIAANYWFKKGAVVYLGFDNCRIEE